MSQAKVGGGVFSGLGTRVPKRDGDGIAMGVDPLWLAYPSSFFQHWQTNAGDVPCQITDYAWMENSGI